MQLQFTFSPNSPQEIPYGYCHCGCGQKTNIATANDKKYGRIKGKPVRFISGHNNHRAAAPQEAPNPIAFCMCGCGQPVRIAPYTSTEKGWVKGQPIKFRMGHGTRKPLSECFWAKAIPGHPDACWIWQGSFKSGGYGKLSFRGKYLGAHRISYELHFGPIPEGMHVLHKCDHPSCVNPNHLFAGTHQDNMDDMVAKGRCRKKR